MENETNLKSTVWLETPGPLLHSQEPTEWKHPLHVDTRNTSDQGGYEADTEIIS